MQAENILPENDGRIRSFPHQAALVERIWSYGVACLTDVELIAVLIGNGTGQYTALDIANNVVADSGGQLGQVYRRTTQEIANYPGLGKTKAALLTAALELGRRRRIEEPHERPSVTSSGTAYELIRGTLSDLLHEEFWLLLLDRGNRLIGKVKISMGGMHGTVADPKLIFNHCLIRKASSIILVHNHPSGQMRPSEEDIRLTRKLTEGGRLLDIGVHDHLIITTSGYYSFADNGML